MYETSLVNMNNEYTDLHYLLVLQFLTYEKFIFIVFRLYLFEIILIYPSASVLSYFCEKKQENPEHVISSKILAQFSKKKGLNKKICFHYFYFFQMGYPVF